jgi:hypothetical protein
MDTIPGTDEFLLWYLVASQRYDSGSKPALAVMMDIRLYRRTRRHEQYDDRRECERARHARYRR